MRRPPFFNFLFKFQDCSYKNELLHTVFPESHPPSNYKGQDLFYTDVKDVLSDTDVCHLTTFPKDDQSTTRKFLMRQSNLQ